MNVFNMNFELNKLREFNKNVTELFHLEFYSYLRENRSLGICVGGKNNPGLKTYFPSEDSTRSFILLVRLVTRDGTEKISFHCLSQYYDSLPVPETYRGAYHSLHKSLNDYLDSSPMTIFTKIPGLTNRRLLNVYLYGKYAHFEEKKKKTLEQWNKLVAYPSLYREFLAVLWGIMDYMEDIRNLNEKTISYLQSK